MQYIKRHPLITGTIILTATGLVSRIIGFFYRIYLSRLFGEEGMGIYQLLNPVLSLSFSLTAAGYQTSISKFVAAQTAQKKVSPYKPMLVGLSISLPLSLLCTGIIFFGAEFIGTRLLLEERTISMLRILSFSIPFGAVHACINGYFYGMKKAGIPAVTQLMEQLARVGCVYGISSYAFTHGNTPSINVAVLGLAVGELFSMIISIISIYACYSADRRNCSQDIGTSFPQGFSDTQYTPRLLGNMRNTLPIYASILGMALPLTANRIVLNLLQSIESVSIPARLRLYGYDTATSLSVYGVLTGMAMPLIFFPNALTGSIAVLLLPMISESHALGDMKAVKAATLRTVKYCLLLGSLCMLVFILLGKHLGVVLFDSELAGHFITTLGFICPFMYLDTTLSSILQGLGLAGHIFVMNVICLVLRLLFVFLAIPHVGITGYLWGVLASQLLQSILYLLCLYRFLHKKA
ncbi:MAG: polysaccharide biosynthesis protein [Lachnospiraceae bacterium]|nr:polysaccharide biosynthesis protein [Lachnospiraceae bacterium]